MDKEKIEQAVRLFLEGIGEDPNREGLLGTPDRVARMCSEIYGGLGQDAGQYLHTTFEAKNNELILEKDIDLYSVCEHHLLPFYGKALSKNRMATCAPSSSRRSTGFTVRITVGVSSAQRREASALLRENK